MTLLLEDMNQQLIAFVVQMYVHHSMDISAMPEHRNAVYLKINVNLLMVLDQTHRHVYAEHPVATVLHHIVTLQ